MKFKAGDKVRIVKGRTFHMNSKGRMDKYLGTVMTIQTVHESCYKMKEDNGEWSWNDGDIQGLANKKTTRQELLDMPVGTKIYTNAEDKKCQLYFKDKSGYFIGKATFIRPDEILEDLTITDDRCGTKIIKIEVPTYETVYDYKSEVQEMTIAEIEKELGHSVKIIKEKE